MSALFGQVIDTEPTQSAMVILAGLLGIALFLALLFYFGFVGYLFTIMGGLLRGAVNRGFAVWRRWLSWANWAVFLGLVLGFIITGWALVDSWPALAIVFGTVPLLMGMAVCLAYVYLDLEQYEVERGHKALNNPLLGQLPAKDLARYGSQVNIFLLAGAATAMVGGFALLNQGLYWSVGESWYRMEQGQAHFADFLVYTLLNLYRIVDLLDLANEHRLVRLAHLQPVYWPASALLIAFKFFFTFVLLEQIFGAVRKGKLLAETIADFFSPHQPIHERARFALPYYGSDILEPMVAFLRGGGALTREQRDELPMVLADIGPGVIPSLLIHLQDQNEQIRAIAVAGLGHLQAVDSLPEMARLQEDPSEIVRLSLVEALGIIIRPGAGILRKKQRLMRFLRGGASTPRWRWRRPTSSPMGIDPVVLVMGQLRHALTDSASPVRSEAARALGILGSAADNAIPDLLVCLRDAAEVVRLHAVEALKNIGPDTPDIVQALTVLLEDPSPAVREASATAMGVCRDQIGLAVSALLPLLQDREETVRQAAAGALSKAGLLSDEALTSLREGLASPDSLIRARTAEAIGQIGDAAQELAPQLAKALEDENDRVRAKVVEALGRIGEEAAPASVPQLVDALEDTDTWVQALAAEALGEMGEAADEAIPALIRSLGHANAQVRYYAAEALGKMGPAASAAMPALEQACQDEDAGVRALAVRALGELGFSARSESGLRQAMQDPDPQVRLAAVTACAGQDNLDHPTRVALIDLLNDPHDQVKIAAARVLARAFAAEPTLVARIIRLMLEDPNPTVREQAATVLGSLGPSAAEGAGPGLVQATKDGEAMVREAALRALIRVQSPEAAGAFVAGLSDEVADIRKLASAAWHQGLPIPEDGLPLVLKALHDPDIQVRANIAWALSRLDELPAPAIPLLLECAQDPRDEMRLNAALALQKATGTEPLDLMGRLIHDPSSRVALLAAGYLLARLPEHEEAREVVGKALVDPSPTLRRVAYAMLESLDGAGPSWLPALRDRLEEEPDEKLHARLTRIIANLEKRLETEVEALPRAE